MIKLKRIMENVDWRDPFGSWESVPQDSRIAVGYRGESGEKSGDSEGRGLYIARDIETAQFFGNVRKIAFIVPKNSFIVDEEPLYILHDDDELKNPISPNDSEWLKVCKMTFQKAIEKYGDEWNSHWNEVSKTQGEILTQILKSKGYDSVYVSSGEEEWVVLFNPKIAKI